MIREGPRRLLCLILLSLLLLAGTATAAGQPDLMVRLSSEGDASYLGKGIFEAVARLQIRTDGTLVGTPSLYRVLLVNAGDTAESFVVKGAVSGSSFRVEFLDRDGADKTAVVTGAGLATGPVAPGSPVMFLVRVTPVAGTPGARCTVTLSAASADSGRADQVKMETVLCGTAAAAMVSVPPDDKGLPGNVVTYPYTVTNIGSGANTFTLSVANSAGWPAAIHLDSAGTQPASSTGPLAPGQSYRFFVTVTVPPGSTDLAHSDTRLDVSGEGAFAWDQVTTTAIAAAVTVADNVRNLTRGGPFAPAAEAYPGDTLEYRMSVTNSGSVPAVAVGIDTPLPQSMKYLPGTLWIGTSSEGDGSPCPLAECGSARITGSGIEARLGQGATDSAGGALVPGRTLYVFFRMQVE